MRDQPNGAELEFLVQRIENGDQKIEVPEDKKYLGLMLEHAVGISRRQKNTGNLPERQEHDRLCVIMKKKGSLKNLNQNLSEAHKRS